MLIIVARIKPTGILMRKGYMKYYCLAFLLLFGLDAAAEEKSASTTESHLFETQISRHASARYLLSLPSGYQESKQQLLGRDHFISDVYERPDLYEWLLQHRRKL